jgi:hypothetical protein
MLDVVMKEFYNVAPANRQGGMLQNLMQMLQDPQ